MNLVRIALLSLITAALGGCLSLPDAPRVYTSFPPMAVSNDPLPPVSEPGQVLKPGLGKSRAGVNPISELSLTERERLAWVPIYPSRTSARPRPADHSISGAEVDVKQDMAGMANLTDGSQDAAEEINPQRSNAHQVTAKSNKKDRQKPLLICDGC
jgi:hypothetical protein